MKRHNRSLGFIFLFVILMLGVILYQSKALFNEDPSSTTDQPLAVTEVFDQEKMATAENQIPFLELLKKMSDCLGGKKEVKIYGGQLESLLSVMRTEYGEALNTRDHSLMWSIRSNDGSRKRLLLTVQANEDGKFIKKLELFTVDSEGHEVQISLDPSQAEQPSDVYINSFLKDVEVIEKIKSSIVDFPEQVQLKYQEKDSRLLQFELHKDKTIFFCRDLVGADSCQCQPFTGG